MSIHDGDLYIADVGQESFEEINILPLTALGANFGWPAFEGNPCVAEFTPAPDCVDRGYTAPNHTIPHPDAGAIIGGSVYTGPVSDLVGRYIFGDYITGRVYAAEFIDGVLVGLDDLTPLIGLHRTLAAVDADTNGDMYLVNVFANTIHRLVPTS